MAGPSPTHQRRVQRQLLFATPFKSLKIRVAQGDKLDKSGMGSVKDPVVRVSLGMDHYETAVGKSVGKGLWDFDSSFEIPFNGQPRLRFLVKDKKDNEIGWHDLNVTRPDWQEAFNGPIDLFNHKGVSGSLRVYCELVPDVCVTPRGTRISDGTPLAAFAAPLAFAETNSPTGAGFGSFRVNVLAATGLLHSKTRSMVDTADPFVEANVGRHSLRTKTIKDGGANPVFGEGFIFPYDGTRKLTLDVYDASDMGTNKKLCGTTVDLAQYMKTGMQPVSIPLANEDGPAGSIAAQIEFLALKEPLPYIVALSAAEIQGVGAGVPLVKSIHFGICNAEFTPGSDSKKNAKLDTLVHVELSKDQKRKTKTAKNQGTHPNFDEVVTFPYSGDRLVTVNLEESEILKNKVIGTGTIDLHAAAAKGTGKKPIDVVLNDPKTGKPIGMIIGYLNMSTEIYNGSEVFPMPAADIAAFRSSVMAETGTGVKAAALSAKSLRVKVFNCEGLGSGDAKKDAKIDPYVFASIDKGMKRQTKAVKNSGGNPAYNQMLHFPYNSQPELELIVYDDDTMMVDSKLGMATIPMATLVPVGEEKIRRIPLFDKHKKPRGFLNCSLELSPLPYDNVEVSDCSPMTAQALGATGSNTPKVLLVKLIASENVTKDSSAKKNAKMDPMVFCELNPKCKRQSSTHSDDGTDVIYTEVLQFPYGGENNIEMTVYDNNNMMKDTKLGGATVDLLPLKLKGLNMDHYHRIPLKDHHGRSNGILHAILHLSSLPYDGREQWPWDARKDMGAEALAAYTLARQAPVQAVQASAMPYATVADSAMLASARSSSSGSLDVPVGLTTTMVASTMSYQELPPPVSSPRGVTGTVGATAPVVYNSDLKMTGVEHDCKQLRVKFISLSELKNPDMIKMGHMDPYIKAEVGRDMLRTKTIKDAGKNAKLTETMAFPFSNKQHIKFTVMEDDKMKDNEIGTFTMDLGPIFRTGRISCPVARSIRVQLKTKKGKPAGFLGMEVHLLNVPVPSPVVFESSSDPMRATLATATALTGYEMANSTARGVSGSPMASTAAVAVPAAVVTREVYDRKMKLASATSHMGVYITCEEAIDLDNSMMMGHADPYMICIMGENKELKSNVFKDAGKNAKFRTTFTYPFANERYCKVEVYDKNTFKDGLIGTIEIDLLRFVEKEESEDFLTIWDKKGKDSGKMLVKVRFVSTRPKEPTVVTLSS